LGLGIGGEGEAKACKIFRRAGIQVCGPPLDSKLRQGETQASASWANRKMILDPLLVGFGQLTAEVLDELFGRKVLPLACEHRVSHGTKRHIQLVSIGVH
jgi:hypothetical protein